MKQLSLENKFFLKTFYNMKNNNSKELQTLNMPWEKDYQYAQGVKKGNTVWLAGQLGHDDKGVLANGMEAQVEESYINIKRLLAGFDFAMDDVVEEVLFVTDMASAFAASKKTRLQYYNNPAEIATTIIEVKGLALPGQLIEIKIIAKK
jgi:2-iminobutanoate/2-iminopropanoate deaminase